MDSNDLFRSIAGEKHLNRVTQSETELDQVQPGEIPATVPEWVPSVSSMSAVMAATMVVMMTSKLWAAPIWLNIVKRLPQKIPCRRCHFFSGNPHLQCAVHPSTVLSKQAIDCPDYWFQDSKSSHSS